MSEIKPVATWETHCRKNPSCAEQAHLFASEAKSIEIEELRAALEALQAENHMLKDTSEILSLASKNFIEETAAQAKEIESLRKQVLDRENMIGRTTIETENLLCKVLGRQWSAAGISVTTLVYDIEAHIKNLKEAAQKGTE